MRICEIFFLLIVIWTPCILCDRWDDQETRRFVEEYIPRLRYNLRRADDDSDENDITSKTITKNSRRYDVHLIKLKSVNGFKRHNLIVKAKSDDNPLIYVINPVETKIPQAFVSRTEFKDILINRVKRQRNEVYKQVDPLLPLLPISSVNSTYWTKLTWSKPDLSNPRSSNIRYQNLFKRRQHNTNPIVTSKNTKKPIKRKNVHETKYKSSPIPYIHYMRNGNKTAKINKIRNLRSKTRKAKRNKSKYLRCNKTSKTIGNNVITLKNTDTIKAKIIYLRSNRSITKRNKKILQNLRTKPMVPTVSHILKKDLNISITEEISKANIIGKLINETIDRQTTKNITTKKSTTENELPATKKKVADPTEVSTTTKQSTEEVTSEKPTNSDITTEKLKADEKTNIESPKTFSENTEYSKNDGKTTEGSTNSEITTKKLTTEANTEKSTTKQSTEEVTSEKTTILDIATENLSADVETNIESPKTVPEITVYSKNELTTEVPTNSENTTEKLTTEDKTTTEPTNTETLNTEHSKEEESMATEKTDDTPATEDTTKSNDITDKTDNNTESVNTEDQEVDLATIEETTQKKHLPFRTTVIKRSTTKARTKTTRTRLSRPLVFMGEMGNGNSWN